MNDNVKTYDIDESISVEVYLTEPTRFVCHVKVKSQNFSNPYTDIEQYRYNLSIAQSIVLWTMRDGIKSFKILDEYVKKMLTKIR